MKSEQRHNWIYDHGGRPLPSAPAQWAATGAAAGMSVADLPSRESAGVRGARAEKLDLPLVSPTRYRSLLVPLDGSAFAEQALPLALGIARRAGADLRLVHVQTRAGGWRGSRFKRSRQAYLDNLARQLAEATRVPVVPLMVDGRDIAAALCAATTRDGAADLVVMATHGRGLLARLCLGGIADTLMRRLSVPLLLVRGHDAPTDLSSEPSVRHVLIALDGSEFGEKVLRPAIGLGTLTGAHHTLLRVIPGGSDYPLVYGGANVQRDLAARREMEAWKYLHEVTKRLGHQSVPIRTQAIFSGQATGRAILHYAERQNADLIALTIRGGSGLSRLFRAGVADQVIRGASVPVLVHRLDTEQERGDEPGNA